MAQPESPHAFPDCRAFMDRAIEADLGTRAIFLTYGKTKSFSLRCYTARHRERKRNKRIYEEGDILYGASVWDKLTFKIRELEDGRWALAAIHDETEALKSLDAEIEDL